MRKLSKRTVFMATSILWLVLLSNIASAGVLDRLLAPKAELWERWNQQDAADQRSIDHASWNRFLATYVKPSADGMNRVAYADVSIQDKTTLDDYITTLSSLPITGYTRPQQFAYWVNLYNALTVKVILDHYPVKSIRDIDISPGLFADGPWRKALVTIEGEKVSLDDIEHRILRPVWADPRIHYAVNCASIGCPDLQTEAFTATNTERLLEKASRDYINHPRGVQVDGTGVTLSSIYNWFAPDFEKDGGVLKHIKRYAEPDLKARLERVDQINGYTYDWALNDKPSE